MNLLFTKYVDPDNPEDNVQTICNNCPRCSSENSLIIMHTKYYNRSIRTKIKCIVCEFKIDKNYMKEPQNA